MIASTRDKLYAWYFIIHIVISLIIDVAIAVPSQFLFEWQGKLLQYHIDTNKDLLTASKPVWLQSFVWLEILVQVPFFFWAAKSLFTGQTSVWPMILVYGVEATVTTYACLAEVLCLDLDLASKINLFLVYLPTFVVPLILTVDFYRRISCRITVRPKQD